MGVIVLAVPTFPVEAAEKEIVGNLAAIVIDTEAVDVKFDELVIVTVWLVAPWAELGVPLITQVAAFKLSPPGKEPVQLLIDTPPVVKPDGEMLIEDPTCPDVPPDPE